MIYLCWFMHVFWDGFFMYVDTNAVLCARDKLKSRFYIHALVYDNFKHIKAFKNIELRKPIFYTYMPCFFMYSLYIYKGVFSAITSISLAF